MVNLKLSRRLRVLRRWPSVWIIYRASASTRWWEADPCASSRYAEAPDDRPTGSPARDGYEGIASLDDAARAAVVYLRAYEATGDARA